jgi:transcriptional regulator with XRE-family HTH domain
MGKKRKYRKRPVDRKTLKRLEYVSQYFRECRFVVGHSRESFAEEHNLNRSFLECMESANHNPTLRSVFLLCDLYEITPEELFTDVI